MGRNRDRPSPPSGPGAGPRVAFVGEAAFSSLSTGARSVLIRPSAAGSLGQRLGGRLDVLVMDAAAPGFSRAAVEELTREARALGAGVVGILAGAGVAPVWDGLVDVALGSSAGEPDVAVVPFVPPIDPRIFNPSEFSQVPKEGLAAVVSPGARAPDLPRALQAVREAAKGSVHVFLPPQLADLDLPRGMERVVEPLEGPRFVKALQRHRGVLDHVGLHPDARAQGTLVVRLAAAGVPVALLEGSRALLESLQPDLDDALASTAIETLGDPHARERASVTLRRAALRGHSFGAVWRRIGAALGRSFHEPPLVSVLLATKRQRFLGHAIEQVNRQSYWPRELVAVLHGDEFADDVERTLQEQVEGPLSIVRAEGRLTLGDALNTGVEAARGDLIAKMDDDDWYGSDHLWDLVLAHEYSGAALVGKAPEFLYLADLDITIRRFGKDAETSNRRIASAGLSIWREKLIEVGGWAAVRSREQVPLINAVLESSGSIHRTHGFGLLVNRHGTGHTWDPRVDYFLVQSERQWRGVEVEAAGVS